MACPVVDSAVPLAPVPLPPTAALRPVVDPSLTAAVGDVARPRRAAASRTELGHLPGESGGLRMHPDRFDPDRFADGRAEDWKHPGQFMPFGAGVHACIGAHLASAEVKAFWYTMVTRCRFRLARDYEGHHTCTPMGSISGDVGLVVERL